MPDTISFPLVRAQVVRNGEVIMLRDFPNTSRTAVANALEAYIEAEGLNAVHSCAILVRAVSHPTCIM